jgi:hypothetical protein
MDAPRRPEFPGLVISRNAERRRFFSLQNAMRRPLPGPRGPLDSAASMGDVRLFIFIGAIKYFNNILQRNRFTLKQ